MNDPISDYVDQLRRALPYDPAASRVVLREARDHLLCATERLQSQGIAPNEASWQSVRNFGSVEEFIRRFEDEGGPMSSRDWNRSVVVAALLVAPAAVFVLANLLAFEVFSNRVLYDAIRPAFDQPWSAVIANVVVTLGPLAAMALTLKQIVSIQRSEGDNDGPTAVVRLKWPHLLVASVALVLTIAIAGYLFFENLPHF